MGRKNILKRIPKSPLLPTTFASNLQLHEKRTKITDFFFLSQKILFWVTKELTVTTSTICKLTENLLLWSENPACFPKPSGKATLREKCWDAYVCGQGPGETSEGTLLHCLLSGKPKALVRVVTAQRTVSVSSLRKCFQTPCLCRYCTHSWHATSRCIKSALLSFFWDIRTMEKKNASQVTPTSRKPLFSSHHAASFSVSLPVSSETQLSPGPDSS